VPAGVWYVTVVPAEVCDWLATVDPLGTIDGTFEGE
jgi:hypothetical protein